MSSQGLSSILFEGGHVDLSSRIVCSTSVVGSPATNAETSIAAVSFPGAISTRLGVIVVAFAAFTVGTSGVSARLRVYHGTVSGTKIQDTGAVTVVAADLYAPLVVAYDPTPVMPNQTYTVSLTIGSGAAASAVSAVTLVAIAV